MIADEIKNVTVGWTSKKKGREKKRREKLIRKIEIVVKELLADESEFNFNYF